MIATTEITISVIYVHDNFRGKRVYCAGRAELLYNINGAQY
jgi:hypothetical protein